MPDNTPIIGGQIVLDTSELEINVKDARRAISSLRSETDVLLSGIDDWTKSTQGLSIKLQALEKEEKLQVAIVKKYADQLQALKTNGNASQGAIDSLQKKLNGAQIALNKIHSAQKSYNSSLEELKATNADGFTSTLAERLKSLSPALANATSGVGGLQVAVAGLAGVMVTQLVKGIKEGVAAFAEYESAFANVRKTISGSEQQMEALNAQISLMAREMPQSASEIANLVAIGGQLGIEADAISEFTKTVIRLGDASTLSSEQAAEMIAQLGAITKLDASDYDRFGSALVELGNNSATTETRILEMASRIARFSQSVGLNNKQILALSTALSSMGVEAEAGGTAMQKMFSQIQLAVETNSDKLQDFAQTAGLSASEFSELFRGDSLQGLQAILKGMDNLSKSGQSNVKTLSDLGITETRLSSVVQALVAGQDLLNKSVFIANEEWEKHTSLTEKAAQRYSTLESKQAIAKNQFDELKRTIGEKFEPTVAGVVSGLGNLASSLTNLLDPFKQVNTSILEITAATKSFSENANEASSLQLANSVIELAKAWKTATKELSDSQDALKGTTSILEEEDTGVVSYTQRFIESARLIDKSVTTVEGALQTLDNVVSGSVSATQKQFSELKGAFSAYSEVLQDQEDATNRVSSAHSSMNAIVRATVDAIKTGGVSIEFVKSQSADLADAVQKVLTAYETGSDSVERAYAKQIEGLMSLKEATNEDERSIKAYDAARSELTQNLETTIRVLQEGQSKVEEGSVVWYQAQGKIEQASQLLANVPAAIENISDSLGDNANATAEAAKEAELFAEQWKAFEKSGGVQNVLKSYGTDAQQTEIQISALKEQIDLLNKAVENGSITSQDASLAITSLSNKAQDLKKSIDPTSISAKELSEVISKYGTDAQKAALKQQELKDKIADIKKKMAEAADPAALQNYRDALEVLSTPVDSQKVIKASEFVQKYGSSASKSALQIQEMETALANLMSDLAKMDESSADYNVLSGVADNMQKSIDEMKATLRRQPFTDLVENWISPVVSAITPLMSAAFDLVDAGVSNQVSAIQSRLSQLDANLSSSLSTLEEQSKTQAQTLKAQFEAGELNEIEYYKNTQKIQADTEKKKQEAEKRTATQRKELAAQMDELKRKQFEADKANSIAQASIDGASAILNIWAHNAGNPVLNGILTAAAVATTALQIATISKQKYVPALAKGGITSGPTMALIGDNPSRREAVIPLEPSTMRMLAGELIGALGQGNQTTYNNSSQADDNRSYVINQTITSPNKISKREAYLQARRALRESREA